jgi:hypothetical protein
VNRKSSHGGRRPGAGRKPGTEPRRRRNVTLTDTDIKRARELGDGNVSLGISRALTGR